MNFVGLDTQEMEAALKEMGEASFRGRQVADWVYKKGAEGFEGMLNLSKELRQRLAREHEVAFPGTVARSESADGSVKLLLEMGDGERVETVRLPYEDRMSVCVSSQAGCAMACQFCATGLGGFRRNLSTAEIISQILLAQRAGAPGEDSKQRATHVVFMGMGEPLLNFNNVTKTIGLMHEEMGIPMRHITVSTVGIINGIEKLGDLNWQLTLAISLHAPDDALRHELIPTSKKTNVKEIVDAGKAYVAKTGRRVTFEYVVLGGVNDTAPLARQLAALCKGWPCHVNLIPWNAVPDASLKGTFFHSPDAEDLRRFRRILEDAGVTVTQRVQRGADVAAACGQLRAVKQFESTLPMVV